MKNKVFNNVGIQLLCEMDDCKSINRNLLGLFSLFLRELTFYYVCIIILWIVFEHFLR